MKAEHIIFMGTGAVGKECLKIIKNAIDETYIECIMVGREPIPTMEVVCRNLHISYRILQPHEVKKTLLQQERETIIFSAHNEYLFPKEAIQKPNIRIINFHNSYLPDYRGRNAPTWAIYEGATYGGATWHEVEPSIDTGGIILQEKIGIETDETGMSLLMKSARVGIRLLEEHVKDFLNGNYKVMHPKRRGKLYLSKEIPNEGFLNLSWDMGRAYRFLRAMDYSPISGILPAPRVRMGENLFQISRYEILKGHMSSGGDRKPYSFYPRIEN